MTPQTSGWHTCAKGGLSADQRQINAFTLAIVKEWSFGPVDAKTLLGRCLRPTLTPSLNQADTEAYRKVLNPEFGDAQDREPGSPYLSPSVAPRAALEGKTPEFPLPWWLRQAHEMYLMGQA